MKNINDSLRSRCSRSECKIIGGAKNNIYCNIDNYIYRFGNDYFRFAGAVAENDYSPEQP